MEPPERHSHDPDRVEDVDTFLRRLLEADPFVVERIRRNALEGLEAIASVLNDPPPPLRWLPAAVAAMIVAAIFAVLSLEPEVPPREPEAAARLSISNADGYVSVSSTAGSQWILVPGDDS